VPRREGAEGSDQRSAAWPTPPSAAAHRRGSGGGSPASPRAPAAAREQTCSPRKISRAPNATAPRELVDVRRVAEGAGEVVQRLKVLVTLRQTQCTRGAERTERPSTPDEQTRVALVPQTPSRGRSRRWCSRGEHRPTEHRPARPFAPGPAAVHRDRHRDARVEIRVAVARPRRCTATHGRSPTAMAR
jgi:hypothetical protein